MNYNNTIKGGIIHVHSENSLKDSAASVREICKRASELGAPAVALTDHGTLTGIEELISAAKETKIKPIPGVEAYYDEDDDIEHRAHLLLLPKDYAGYIAISKAVTSSNNRLDSQNIPRMNAEILRKYFGEGSDGHNHVIACSACMAGVLSSVLLLNEHIETATQKLIKKREKLYNPNSPQYAKNRAIVHQYEEDVDALSEKIKNLDALTKKPYTKKEKALNAFRFTNEYEAKKAALEKEKAESLAAAVEIETCKETRISLKAKLREVKNICKVEEKDHEKWYRLTAQIDALKTSIIPEEKLFEMAKARALEFSDIFGNGNFYAELQYHRIPQEARTMPLIADIATELSIPVVATNDAHVIRKSDDEFKARQIMRSLRYNKWEPMNESDKELYIKTDEELASILSEILPTKIVDMAMAGIKDIVDACNVVFDDAAHYPVYVSDTDETSVDRLRRLSNEGISWRYPEKWTEVHQQRMEYELGIIEKLGFCDYLCVVADFLHYGRLLGKIDLQNPDPQFIENQYNIEFLEEITKGKVGVGIGPGRGSGVGSLVCYLTGITDIDPIKYNLIFERFLNVERVSMPDVDSDFRPDVRERVIEYVKHKYGEKSVCRIIARGRQMAKAAIRNAARLLGSELYDDTKVFLSLGDEICKSIPTDLNVKLDDCADDLREKYSDNKNALTIINNAMLVEGVFTNVSVHAAAVVISDNDDVSDYIPLMYVPGKQQFASQLDKDECEAKKLLKMDFLGLRNLAILDDTVRMIENRYGTSIELKDIPFEADVFKNIFAEGNTNAVFQFESDGMKQMLRQFKPDCIEDLILLVACYRPGPIQYLDSIISVKNGKNKPKYIIPEMQKVLGNTYGFTVYQEQLMRIFNEFAGFSLGEADIIRRYMSKKKVEKFAAYKDKFIEGLIAHGAREPEAEKFWDELVKFSEYAFNASHAAAYAFVAYYTAWFKYRYPKEYLCAVMNYTKFDKLNNLIGDCRAFDINIVAPDINTSAEKFSVIDNSIICGLGSVKNVGNAANKIIEERNTNGLFISFADFLLRTRVDTGVAESLITAGAFDAFTDSRAALKDTIADYNSILKKIKDREKKLEDETDAAKIRKIEASHAELRAQIHAVPHSDMEDEALQKLLEEKAVVGAFISSHPLDSYPKPESIGCTPINKLSAGYNANIMGLITNLRLVNRKSDKAKMAFFDIEDSTGTIPVCCFADSFAKNADLISEDAIIKVKGKCIDDVDSVTDEHVFKMVLETAETVKVEKSTIIIFVEDFDDWGNIKQSVLAYHDRDGCEMQVYNKKSGKFMKYRYLVSKAILKNKTMSAKTI